MLSRSALVYSLLAAAWLLVVGWQAVEHHRVTEAARQALRHRARDITTTLGMIVKAQRRFASQERLESALQELVRSDELISIALFNAALEVVASAGVPTDLKTTGTVESGERWDAQSMRLVNLVDLGANIPREGESSQPTIILPRRDPSTNAPDERPSPPRPSPRPSEDESSKPDHEHKARSESGERGERSRGPDNRYRFGRPFWMNEDEYRSLIQKQGLHGFVIVMSTQSIQTASAQDLWVRWIIGSFSAVSALGLGLAWRNLDKSSSLQMRLLRASQLNVHLREMNLAAAGLAHETRNPLNIIRGLAQMISKESSTSPDVRAKSAEITDEVDRISAQLNEFINYSKPREVRKAPVTLSSVIGDVVRALQSDLEDRSIRLERQEEDLVVEADQQMLRQVLFNLLMNAIQAVEPKGLIEISARKSDSTEAIIEVKDNGPGVAPENRREIFRPYFTTRPSGTGLGLAVVHQIASAHGWDVECLPNQPRGAVFRITRLQRSVKG